MTAFDLCAVDRCSACRIIRRREVAAHPFVRDLSKIWQPPAFVVWLGVPEVRQVLVGNILYLIVFMSCNLYQIEILDALKIY